jgi:hypothetical protein
MMGHENFLGVRGGGADGRKKARPGQRLLARCTYCIRMYLLYHGFYLASAVLTGFAAFAGTDQTKCCQYVPAKAVGQRR